MSTPSPRWRAVRALAVFAVALVLLMAGNLALYASSRHWAEDGLQLGDFDKPDRVDLTVWVNRVDTETTTVAATITDIEANGKYADESGHLNLDTKLLSNSFTNPSVNLPSGETVPVIEQKFGMVGIPTDYPFDRYTAFLGLNIAADDGTALPTTLTVFNNDSFFRVALGPDPDVEGDSVDADLFLHRSAPTLVFAVFVMLLMLGLAAAAVTASYYALRWRRGLVLPACSMMAAILFALIPLRNAVPGGPPIGSLIDFVAFFIAEGVISIALITSVVLGYRHDIAYERAEAERAGLSIDEYALGRKP
ncbi:DUF4436 family protein [Mycobacterium neumannii]|uniref:DUF4436 family protein n=1 Tax=Mycobacterium neumannii TaxID=2048551 RepID=UPI003AB8578F